MKLAMHEEPLTSASSSERFHSAAQHISSLPAHIQASIFSFSGMQGASALAMVCTGLHQDIWDDADIWHAMVVLEQPHRQIVLSEAPQMAAQMLRDELRWERYGIAALRNWRKRPPAAHHAYALKAAQRAIHGLLPGDGPRCIEAIVSAVTDLLRWYDSSDDAAHENARLLVQKAAAKKDVFNRDQIRELRRALEDSKVLRVSLVTIPQTLTVDDPAPFGVLFSEAEFMPSFTDDRSYSDGDASPAPHRCGDDHAAMDRILDALRHDTMMRQA
jgi:hypothetical protein